jgi:hypothetical protein
VYVPHADPVTEVALENIEVLSEEDKQSVAYHMCVGATTIVGAAVGAPAGPGGVVAGGAVGLAIGLKACPYLATPVKKKIFSSKAKLTEKEVVAALRAIRLQQPGMSKSDALNWLAAVRQDVAQKPMKYRSMVA